jgi:DnaJ domain
MTTIPHSRSADDPYAQLGLAHGAAQSEVKRAYRRLAMRFHPDRAGPGSLRSFLAVKAAYDWIVAHQPVQGLGARPAVGARTPADSAPMRSSWQGGRWYWEGMRARASRQ